MAGAPVGVGVDSNRFRADLVDGTDYPDSDFTAISYEDASKHARVPHKRSVDAVR
jgi:hypothetical protein